MAIGVASVGTSFFFFFFFFFINFIQKYVQKSWVLVKIENWKNGEKLCDRNALSFSTLQI